jgi:hypothetical protein
MQRRAQLGQDRRERDRIRRERRRGDPVNQQLEAVEETEEEQGGSSAAESDIDDGLSQHERERRRRERAESIPWDDEERWRPENFNVAPRSNCPIIVMRPVAARLRGGGGGGESYEKPKDVVEAAIDMGDQALCIETM